MTIDLRSDTVTRPTAAMREVMARAEVGDDVYGDDPTVRALEDEVAAIVGKEAALFVASGVMSNQIALLVSTRPGDEIVCGEGAHLAWYESGAAAALSGVQCHAVGRGGQFTAADLDAAVKPRADWYPRTSLVALENTHNRAGGRIFPQADVVAIGGRAHALGLGVHLDGARLWNASVASGRSEAELAAPADTVSVCFSKGLGAPIGSALCGTRALVAEARRARKRLGGGWRQAGILAAAARHALAHHRARLVEDHDNAALLARELASRVGHTGAVVTPPETNVVMVDVPPRAVDAIVADGERAGVRFGAIAAGRLRFVLHLDVSRADVLAAAPVIAQAIERACAT